VFPIGEWDSLPPKDMTVYELITQLNGS